MPTMVDLFSGTGGASSSFLEHGWRVLRVDLVRRPGVIVADVRHLPFDVELRGKVDLLWMSPPCTEFSQADARVDHSRKVPSLELVAASLKAVAELRPRFWILENVKGAIPFLGIPAQKIGPWCFWGYFPEIRVPDTERVFRKSGLPNAAARGSIPRGLSAAVRYSVERHFGVKSLLDMQPRRRRRAWLGHIDSLSTMCPLTPDTVSE